MTAFRRTLLLSTLLSLHSLYTLAQPPLETDQPRTTTVESPAAASAAAASAAVTSAAVTDTRVDPVITEPPSEPTGDSAQAPSLAPGPEPVKPRDEMSGINADTTPSASPLQAPLPEPRPAPRVLAKPRPKPVPRPDPVAVLRRAAKGAMPGGDAGRGRLAFGPCRTCHYPELAIGHNNGPNLHRIFGRIVGTAPGFEYYSATFRKAGFAWTPELLFAWLADPMGMFPDTSMMSSGIPDPQQRADLIAYLQRASLQEP